ncbi:MAG TPA: hypothetical protein VGR50_02985 [Terriglobales bacterium]|nr:hypothetical protein [Terriglobales bacterium]
MAKNKQAQELTEVARKIGSTLGETVAKANRVVKGVKAAAKAGKEAYARGAGKTSAAKPARKRRAPKKSSA